MDFYTFEEAMKAHINRSGLSQAEVARRLGCAASTLTKWITQTNQISTMNLEKFCKLLALSEEQRAELFILARHAVPPTVSDPALINAAPYSLGVAPSPPNLLLGRDQDLKNLYDRLTAKANIRPLIVVRGWPGVGKTTVAQALAHDKKVQKSFPDGLLWATLGLKPNVPLRLGQWLRSYGLDPHEFPTVESQSKRLAAILRHKKMLIIIDNVWEAAHGQPFLVGGKDCRTLITTRELQVAHGLGLSGEAIYNLAVLDERASLDLIREFVPQLVQDEEQGTKKLVQALGHLPLALQVAGRLLAEEVNMGWDVSALLQELIEGTRLLDEQAPTDRTDLATQTTPTLTTLLEQSTNRLDQLTRERFAMLGTLGPKPTLEGVTMGSAWQVDDFKPTIRALVNRGLLEPVAQGRFQLHALLALHAKLMYTHKAIAAKTDPQNSLGEAPTREPAINKPKSKPFDLQHIRSLLVEGFNDKELRRFCYDDPNFRAVYERLAEETGKDSIIDKIIEYADQKELLEILLAWANKCNPVKYKKYQPYQYPPRNSSLGANNPAETGSTANHDALGHGSDNFKTISGILQQFQANLDDDEKLEQILWTIEQQRQDSLLWMSRTQRQILELIPTEPIIAAMLLSRIRAEIAPLSQIRDKELYLRLHELRYLGWIERKLGAENKWHYWRDHTAEMLTPDKYKVRGQRMGHDEVQTIKGILQQVHSSLGHKEQLKKRLASIEADRQNSSQRLSQTQQAVLNTIPEVPTFVDFVLINIRQKVASLSHIRDKELYMRLYELRYLGLITRKLEDDQWYYWRESAPTRNDEINK